jgi:glycosyltransferase involved in cell wall biosynthesis
MPRVSVITATYNRSDVLRWAIESVRAQTFEDWEQIVIGDGCTDDTGGVIASFEDRRIRFVNRPVNHGEQSVPNNDGFKQAKGDLVAYLNHDDLWFPDHLKTLVSYLERTGADLVYALPVSIDRHGTAFCGVTNAELCYDPSHFVPSSLWLVRSALLKKLGGWRPAREIHARNPSQDLLYRAWLRTRKLRCQPRITAMILASGGRPGCYVTRDDSQHRRFWERMQTPEYREELATAVAMETARELARVSAKHTGFGVRRLLDRVMVSLHLHPDAVRNRLAGRRKGWWIDYLRELRGLPPMGEPGRKP